MLATLAQPTRPIRKETTVITHTADGWMLTLGQRTYGPYPTCETAAEAQYDAERGRTPQPAGNLVDAVLAYVTGDNRIALAQEADRLLEDDELAVAEWIDGAPVVSFARVGLSDGSGGDHKWDEYTCGGNILNIDDGAFTLWSRDAELGEWTPGELIELRTLLNDPRVVAALDKELFAESLNASQRQIAA